MDVGERKEPVLLSLSVLGELGPKKLSPTLKSIFIGKRLFVPRPYEVLVMIV